MKRVCGERERERETRRVCVTENKDPAYDINKTRSSLTRMRCQAERGSKTPQEYVNMSETPSTPFTVLRYLPFATLAVGTHIYMNCTE